MGAPLLPTARQRRRFTTTVYTTMNTARSAFPHGSGNIRSRPYRTPRRFCNDLSAEQTTGRGDDEVIRATTIHYNNLPRLYVGQLPSDPVVITSLNDIEGSILRPTASRQLSKDSLVQLSIEQSHYLTSVLRLTKSSRRRPPNLRVVNESGEEWLAELILPDAALNDGGRKRRRDATAASETATVVCRSKLRSHLPSPISCWLCVAPPKKKDRLKWLIEKTTELDCTGYIFLDTDYSEATVDNGKDHYKANHNKNAAAVIAHSKLQAYAVEAAEQCERLTLPHFVSIRSPAVTGNEMDDNRVVDDGQTSLKSVVASGGTAAATTKLTEFLSLWSFENRNNSNGVKLLACRERYNNDGSLSSWRALEQIYATATTTTSPTTVVAFMIGPEGGWSPKEEEMMDELERDHPDAFFIVSLGPTVLRAETAAMTSLAAFALHHHDHHLTTNKQQSTYVLS